MVILGATVREGPRDTPIRSSADVLVVGGGLGGVSAAVAAARAGASTLLVERNGYPGGVATAGMCCSVFNCFYTPKHELIVRGNALEFVEALGQDTGASRWRRHKGHIIYDLERGKLALIEMLEAAGVACLFDALAVGAIMDGNNLKGALIESKSGRQAILAHTVIDATGDADLARLAGAPVRTIGPDIRARHSYPFRLGNVDVDRFVSYFCERPERYPPYMDVDWTFDEAHAHYQETGTFLFPHGGGEQLEIIQRGVADGSYPTHMGVYDSVDALQMHALRHTGIVHMVTGFMDMDDLEAGLIPQAMNDGKRLAFQIGDYFRAHVPGFERACVVGTADDLGIRASRWIDGEFSFGAAMRSGTARIDDAIGRGVAQRNYAKNLAPGAWGAQTFRDETFDIPYRCLLPRNVEGLLMGSGRSVSAENPMLLRVMAHTMVIGQGAGVAAAVSARDEVLPRQVAVDAVQAELIRQGVALDPRHGAA